MQASPAASASLGGATAARYNIGPADLPILTTAVRSFMVKLGAWETDEQAYVAKVRAGKQLPDTKTLIAYQMQRQRLVIDAYSSAHATLSPASWTGLYGYINGAFRLGLRGGK
jgi:hypothetical protein